MPFWATALPFAVDAGKKLFDKGSKTPPARSRPGNVLQQNPGEPNGEQFRQALSVASQPELDELRAAYENAVKDFTFSEAITDPQFVLHGAWGGDDGKVKGGEVRLQKACIAILNNHKMGDGPLTFPVVYQQTPWEQTVDRFKSEAGKLPERIAGAAANEVAQSTQRATQPVTQDIVQRKLSQNAIYVVVGIVAAFALSGVVSQVFKQKKDG
jgi:hypothetical protein